MAYFLMFSKSSARQVYHVIMEALEIDQDTFIQKCTKNSLLQIFSGKTKAGSGSPSAGFKRTLTSDEIGFQFHGEVGAPQLLVEADS